MQPKAEKYENTIHNNEADRGGSYCYRSSADQLHPTHECCNTSCCVVITGRVVNERSLTVGRVVVKEQAARIEKVSNQLAVSKSAPQIVLK